MSLALILFIASAICVGLGNWPLGLFLFAIFWVLAATSEDR
jgi:hypothetical protein